MAQQENGWPLGLQPLNIRAGLVGHGDYSGSVSFNTLLTGSPSSSTNSSSDLDTESTGSFFHDRSITLGNLIGVSSFLELSGRSGRGRRSDSLRHKKSYKSKTWLFSLCSKTSCYTVSEKNTPRESFGHFLEVERRAVNGYQRNQSPFIYEPGDFSEAHPVSEPNSLFVNGHVTPPQSSPWLSSNVERMHKRNLSHGSGCGVPVLLSCCMCAQTTN
ncbi:hypothetical protein GIB67_011810 [Kingdonia uniflora]|uniref:Uncharacterized protein n=1 Tax=Kingdonia uniflora TaxID=39325 RepID=A0A7J7NXV4_9MAGN|nr:hypothetical protein GIB67_011810 [Kingdonia uniflora]